MKLNKEENDSEQVDVTVVMPVCNEEECIAAVIDDWLEVLASCGCRYRLLVLNDGSSDNTADVLQPYEANPCVLVINKPNEGHGPTILRGYQSSVKAGIWVFQTDSDNEIAALEFRAIWAERNQYDFLYGQRRKRMQGIGRYLVSFVSRLLVSLLSLRRAGDVNVPFRLMRSEVLAGFLMQIPASTFAPNVAITGLFLKKRMRYKTFPVQYKSRQTGKVSIVHWKLFKSAILSFCQSFLILIK
ncbi:glycosyltransferase family 2 protein [Verrucomicrobiota bacterium]